MPPTLSRPTLLALALAAVLAAPRSAPAAARPGRAAHPGEVSGSALPHPAGAWSWLAALLAGLGQSVGLSTFPPIGATAPPPGGCPVDATGRCVSQSSSLPAGTQSENGCGIDPNGRCLAGK